MAGIADDTSRASDIDRDPKALWDAIEKLDSKLDRFMFEMRQVVKEMKQGIADVNKTHQQAERDLTRTPAVTIGVPYAHQRNQATIAGKRMSTGEPSVIKPIQDNLGRPPEEKDYNSDSEHESVECNQATVGRTN